MTIFNELDRARGLCPKCGADRALVFQMIQENHRLDNWEYAHKIIENCKACKAELKNLDWLCENIPER